MVVSVKFVGSFRGFSGRSGLRMRFVKSVSVEVVVKKVVEKLPRLEAALIDSGSGGPRRNVLVLVNGREIGVLDGFETVVADGDEVVFVPVAHGG
jgi:molybdopterin converting factor small subunit